MHPFLFRIPLPWGGYFKLPSYGFCIVCGFLLALWLLRRRSRRFGLNPNDLMDLAIYTLFAGVVGSRLFYVIQFWSHFKNEVWMVIRVDQGGLVFYGGMIGGLAVVTWIIYTRRLPALVTLDMMASVVPLAHALGRMGCFMNGCCYGRPTHGWWAVMFPRILDPATHRPSGSLPFMSHWSQHLIPPDATHSLPIHPTQLYAVGYHLVIFSILTVCLWRLRRPGAILGLYLILYPIARFTNEYFRVTPPMFLDMSVAQAIGLPLLAAGLVLFVRAMLRPRKEFAPYMPPEPESGEASDADASGESGDGGEGRPKHRKRRKKRQDKPESGGE